MAISETENYCSFCLTDSKALQKGQTLHAGLEAFICDDCVDTINYVKSKDYVKSPAVKAVERFMKLPIEERARRIDALKE